jgi:hypothetical protein
MEHYVILNLLFVRFCQGGASKWLMCGCRLNNIMVLMVSSTGSWPLTLNLVDQMHVGGAKFDEAGRRNRKQPESMRKHCLPRLATHRNSTRIGYLGLVNLCAEARDPISCRMRPMAR